MPQVWLTYEELGASYDREAMRARESVKREGWTRRRCSDGLTRVKLPTEVAVLYLEGYGRRSVGTDPTDGYVAALREILERAGETRPRISAHG